MDDNNSANTPSIDSIPPASPFQSAPSTPKKSPLKPILITAILIILVGVGAFAIFKYRDALSSLLPGNDSKEEVQTEIVYTTPEGSQDPVADFITYQEKRIASASTPLEKLSVTLDLAEYLLHQGETSRAVAVLDSLSPADFTTDRELYSYYSAYAQLYSEGYLNKPDLAAEYSALAAQHDPNRPVDYPED